MPAVTFDGRTFLIGGKRVWLVSGSVHYARIPRDLWADRIHAARLAGLNTIETPVFWNRHEPIPGHFDFSGDNDLRHFVQLARDAGLYVILRPGPFIASGWDFGGLPPWLLQIEGIEFRTANGRFLEAVSRYFTAFAEQIRDLQITASGRGGPIILIQNEMAWTCGKDDLAVAYLGELNRYLREAGLTVPTINANNLWQGIEGEIDCWTGSEHLLAVMRQLMVVQPESPRLVIDFPVAPTPVWGKPFPQGLDTPGIVRRLLEILAGGGQFNITPFVGGTNFGASASRLPDASDAYTTTIVNHLAPVDEGGEPGTLYHPVRRVATFANRFNRLLANLELQKRPIILDPATLDTPSSQRAQRGAPRCAVVHAAGAQGDIAFVFADPAAGPRQATILLPDGLTLDVPLGRQSAAWCLFNVGLTNRAVLDYCNLSIIGQVGETLVCFGPAGAECALSINGTPLNVAVSRGKPSIVRHEGITILICNEDEADRTFIFGDNVYVGAESIRADGSVIPTPNADSCFRLDAEGRQHHEHAPPNRRAPRPRLNLHPWNTASAADYVSGESPRFAPIDGPKNLTHLGAPSSYGWYRLAIRSTAAKRLKVAFPQAGDRLHLYSAGAFVGIVGHGPGAQDNITLPLKKGETTVVVLADNLGRVSGGAKLGEHKGLFGHAWAMKPLRVGKPTVEVAHPVEALSAFAPLWEVAKGDHTTPQRLTWKFNYRRKNPLFVSITGFIGRGIVFLNNHPIYFIGRSGYERVRIDGEPLARGANTLQIALLADEIGHDGKRLEPADALADLARIVRIEEGATCLTEKADWAFARWEPPPPSAFHEANRNDMVGNHGPRWWKAAFDAADAAAPIRLDLTGMTKGHVYVNGRHLGRFFVSTVDKKPVGPQTLYYIPEPWLNEGADNELLIFDEHGGNPSKVRFVTDSHAHPIRAAGTD